jgi:hypothetical protein
MTSRSSEVAGGFRGGVGLAACLQRVKPPTPPLPPYWKGWVLSTRYYGAPTLTQRFKKKGEVGG